MLETRALIIHQILKLDRPFKPRHIWEPIGISSQNLNNHLVRMMDKGILSKNGTIYTVASKELLIDELTPNERISLDLPVDRPIINRANLRKFLLYAVTARALGKTFAGPLTVVMNRELDDQIEELKEAKKYLNRKVFSENRAEKLYDGVMGSTKAIWQIHGSELETFMTEQEFTLEAYNTKKGTQ